MEFNLIQLLTTLFKGPLHESLLILGHSRHFSIFDEFPWKFILHLFTSKPVNSKRFKIHNQSIFGVGIFWIFLIIAYFKFSLLLHAKCTLMLMRVNKVVVYTHI